MNPWVCLGLRSRTLFAVELAGDARAFVDCSGVSFSVAPLVQLGLASRPCASFATIRKIVQFGTQCTPTKLLVLVHFEAGMRCCIVHFSRTPSRPVRSLNGLS